ncbi:MAG: TenA family protein [Calothrix sp. FI2-JRJ7]|jgi:thiaminase/transcriptional activator TenA|nr:TenA family protein [Calothrix sp. FI2-JRJ7]
MSISSTLWRRNQDLAQACLDNPFVRGIGDGSLPRHKFAYYVGQDAFFLEAFARAYSIAAAKAPDFKGFRTFHALAGGVLEELQLHQSYAKTWGIDIKSVSPGAATRRYTDFLVATAWGENIGLTATAMSPCMRLYEFLGKELAHDGIPEHDYSEWIRVYSGADFHQIAQELDDLVDTYTTEIDTVHSTYRYAMQCELDFFQAAWTI